ncbi:hypothetical protein ACFV0H_27960 [Streptomyces erythrochromogenes]|uniref:hypothetical protein n=1 Tax=Streptomyces erythrochromogenes TaxID=285574 RepID=UPI00068FBD60
MQYGVPRAWWVWLGVAKAAGVFAAVGVAAYFAGAVVTVVRARAYAHVPFPVVYAAPAVVALALGFGG